MAKERYEKGPIGGSVEGGLAAAHRVLLFYSLGVLILYAYAAFYPSHYNWGFHYFAFLPPGLTAGLLLGAMTMFIPQVRMAVLSASSRLVTAAKNIMPMHLLGLLLAGWVGLMLAFPDQLHMLGDSGVILRFTPDRPSIENLNANFRNQPLTYELLRLVQWVIGMGDVVKPIFLYRVVDLGSGAIYLILIFYFIRKLGISPLESMFIGTLFVFRVENLFFFGYVENYHFFYVTLTAFLLAGWLACEQRLPLWMPISLAALIPCFHYVGIVFLPAALLLVLPYWRTHRRLWIAGMAGFGILLSGVVLFTGTPETLIQRFSDALRYDLLPITTPTNGIPYGLFSSEHLVDWTNAMLHSMPFGLISIIVGMILVPRKEYEGSPVFVFLATASVLGLGASLVLSPGLGMARDWDMFSIFFTPLHFLRMYILILVLRRRLIRQAVLLILIVSTVRWIGWIGVNSVEERAIARAEILTAPELSGTFSRTYYEHLALLFYKKHDYGKARKWYEKYLAIDSTHPRILANLSDCYRELGDNDNLFRLLELSVRAKSKDARVYSNLAVEYMARGDSDRALSHLERALRLDPGLAVAHANSFLLQFHFRNYRKAIDHARRALQLGLQDPQLYKGIAYAYYHLNDDRAALDSFRAYLASTPPDNNIRTMVRKLERRLGVPPSL